MGFYQYYLNKDKSYDIWFIDDQKETKIAIAYNAEKAYFLCQAANAFPDRWFKDSKFLKAMDEYENSISAKPEQQGWISVEDTPPPENVWILVYNGFWTGVAKYDKCEDEDMETPEWQDETHEYFTPLPTHWQPLPSPPKNKQ